MTIRGTRRWRKLRRQILAREPVCVMCGMRPSEEVDHVVAVALGGSDRPANLRGLCGPCHRARHILDVARRKVRPGGTIVRVAARKPPRRRR